MHFEPGDLVVVRYSTAQPWFSAEVTGLTPRGDCYVVDLDAPQPTRLQWTGISRPLGNDSVVFQTSVYCQLDKLAPQQLMSRT